MGDSSPSDTILGSPSNDQRCIKSDGKFWRCSMWKMQGKSLCQKHFLKQVEYKNKKKNMSPHHQNKPNKRKTPITNDDVDKNKKNKKSIKKKKNKEDEIKTSSSGDDSIDKLFEDNYSSEKDKGADSIDELFEDNYTSCSSDADSCALVTRPRSKVSTMSPRGKEEPVEEPDRNQETVAESTTGRI